MKTLLTSLFLAVAFLSGSLSAGTVSYEPIPAARSDAGSGISDKNSYLSALSFVTAPNTNLAINGVTFQSLLGQGQTSTSNGITLSAATGTLTNVSGTSPSVQADGVLRTILSNSMSNSGAENGSEQYLTLDTGALQPGITYDLRIYIANAASQNRQVNLAFVGDGNPPVETDFFNEDDATTSAGGFADPNQVYYISYRFQWDGQTIPGVTITQTDGGTPFCLYAVTNQVVPAEPAAPPPAVSQVAPPVTAPPAAPPPAAAPPEAETASEDVGVNSEVFYNDPGLKKRGRWVTVAEQTAWEPTDVPPDWTPYTDGSWAYSDDLGWTWTTDEEWGWATYHYGRWVRSGRRWFWTPGRVWAPAWVSWRYGGSYVGWAPLPPDAGFRRSIGISVWADRVYDIGPLNYSFVRVRDFGAENISRVVINQTQNVNIITRTTNITNIVNNNTVIYNGGPNKVVVNKIIQNSGGKEIQTIKVNRDSGVTLPDGKHTKLKDGILSISTPVVKPVGSTPMKPTETIDKTKVDRGWDLKDPKLTTDLKNRLTSGVKNLTPENAPATLPKNLTDKNKAGVSPTPPGPQGNWPATSPRQSPTATTGITKPGATPGHSPTLAPTGSPRIIKPGTTPGQSPTAAPTGSPRIIKPGTTPGQSPTLAPTATPRIIKPGTTPAASPTLAPTGSPRIIKPGTTPAASPTVGQTPSPGIMKPGATPGRSPTVAPTLSPVVTKPGATPRVAPTISPVVTQPVPTPKKLPTVGQTPVPVITRSPVITKPQPTPGQTPLTVKKPVATPGPDKRVQSNVAPSPAITTHPKTTATPVKNVRTTQTPAPTQIHKAPVTPVPKHIEPPKKPVEKPAPVVKVPPKPAPVIQAPKPAPVIQAPPKPAPVVKPPPPKPGPVIPPPGAKPKPTPTPPR